MIFLVLQTTGETNAMNMEKSLIVTWFRTIPIDLNRESQTTHINIFSIVRSTDFLYYKFMITITDV